MECKDCDLLLNKIRQNLLEKAKDGKWIQKVTREMEAKGTKGKFAEWCGGKVTKSCIEKGLRSKDPKIRKRAQLAKNFMEMRKKAEGGEVDNTIEYTGQMKELFLNKLRNNNMIELLHNIAQKGLDLEDEYDNIINSYQNISQITKSLNLNS